MIRVRIELIPQGDERRARELGRIEIANTSREIGAPVADYHVRAALFQPNGDLAIHNRTLHNHPRRVLNVLGLITAALEALGPDVMRNDSAQRDLER